MGCRISIRPVTCRVDEVVAIPKYNSTRKVRFSPHAVYCRASRGRQTCFRLAWLLFGAYNNVYRQCSFSRILNDRPEGSSAPAGWLRSRRSSDECMPFDLMFLCAFCIRGTAFRSEISPTRHGVLVVVLLPFTVVHQVHGLFFKNKSSEVFAKEKSC